MVFMIMVQFLGTQQFVSKVRASVLVVDMWFLYKMAIHSRWMIAVVMEAVMGNLR